jgi:hypothetical protein
MPLHGAAFLCNGFVLFAYLKPLKLALKRAK